jgi:hypothetical protein
MLLLLVILKFFICIGKKHEKETDHRKNLRVVIARYVEPIANLTWLQKFQHTIYSRSVWDDSHGLNILRREANVGREGFVYLSHIIQNYDSMEPITVFLQGDNAIRGSSEFQLAIINILEHHKEFNNYGFQYISHSCHESYVFNFVYMEKLLTALEIGSLRGNMTLSAEKEFDWEFKHLMTLLYGNAPEETPMFSPGGSLAVSSELIRKKPLSYYMNLAMYIGKENCPAIGYFYERTWSYLFNSSCSTDRKCSIFREGCRY